MGALTVLLALSLTLGLSMSQSAPVPVVSLGSQAWWSATGIAIPSSVGAHIHLDATVPADGFPIDGSVDVPVKVTAHNQTGAITLLRVSNGSTVMQSWPLSLGPCVDCSWSGTVTVNFSAWPTGRDEMRWTANLPKNDLGNRQYQSTGWQVCIRSCTPSYRSGVYLEARGWYTGRGYQNARLTSPLTTVQSGGTITVKLAPGSGGLPTTFSGAYIDPDFHNGSAGLTIFSRAGSYTGTIVIPALAPGPHKLVLLSSDGLNAGVLGIPFVTP